MSRPRDVWTAGELYEPYVGRWSRVVAAAFVDRLSVPDGRDWLDVGCGTGALTSTILAKAAPRSVTGVDPSEAFLEHAKRHVDATFEIGDATQIPMEDDAVDAAVSGLVLNFVGDPARAVSEMARCTRGGGVVAAYVWDYAGKMELMRYFWDAAVELDADAADEGPRFPICAPGPLSDLFASAGLGAIETRAIDVRMRFRDFDDYWSPFLGGVGPAPAYAMSLPEERRNTLRDLLRERLPVASDGSIDLLARAWAVRGDVTD